jgi:hypothetical protein
MDYMGSEVLNEEAATTYLLFRLQKYSLNNAKNLIKNHTIIAPMMSVCNISL